MTGVRFIASAYKEASAISDHNIRVVLMSEIDPGRSFKLGTLLMTTEEYAEFTTRMFPTSPRPGSALDPTLQDPLPAFDFDRDTITPLTDLEPRHA